MNRQKGTEMGVLGGMGDTGLDKVPRQDLTKVVTFQKKPKQWERGHKSKGRECQKEKMARAKPCA